LQVSLLFIAIAAKRLELLHEFVPTATLIAYLAKVDDPVGAQFQTKELEVAAGNRGVRLLILKVSDPSEFETAFMTLVRERAEGLLVGADPLFGSHSDQLAVLAARYRVPAIYPTLEGARTGGLMSYGVDSLEAYRLAGVYAGRILKGEKPADLPVQLVRKIGLAINLKAAKALGIAFPPLLLNRADEMIE
jgi:putative ABC transport system substrate-binding protein